MVNLTSSFVEIKGDREEIPATNVFYRETISTRNMLGKNQIGEWMKLRSRIKMFSLEIRASVLSFLSSNSCGTIASEPFNQALI